MVELRWRLLAARQEGATPLTSFALMVESLALFHALRGDLAFLGASEMRGLATADRERITALPTWFRPDGELGAEQVARRYADYALALLR